MVAIASRANRITGLFLESRSVPGCVGEAWSASKAFRRSEPGTMLIETAIVLPVFFMMLFGIFNISMIVFGRGNAVFAANAAARYAALHSSTAVVPSTTSSVQSYALGFLYGAPSGGITIGTTYSPGNNIGDTVTVTVSLTYSTGVQLYGINAITVSGSAKRTISR